MVAISGGGIRECVHAYTSASTDIGYRIETSLSGYHHLIQFISDVLSAFRCIATVQNPQHMNDDEGVSSQEDDACRP